jgi:hypothetical protein
MRARIATHFLDSSSGFSNRASSDIQVALLLASSDDKELQVLVESKAGTGPSARVSYVDSLAQAAFDASVRYAATSPDGLQIFSGNHRRIADNVVGNVGYTN